MACADLVGHDHELDHAGGDLAVVDEDVGAREDRGAAGADHRRSGDHVITDLGRADELHGHAGRHDRVGGDLGAGHLDERRGHRGVQDLPGRGHQVIGDVEVHLRLVWYVDQAEQRSQSAFEDSFHLKPRFYLRSSSTRPSGGETHMFCVLFLKKVAGRTEQI